MGRTVQSREDGVSKNEAMQERRHHDRFGGAEGIRRNGQEAHDGTTPEQRGTYEQQKLTVKERELGGLTTAGLEALNRLLKMRRSHMTTQRRSGGEHVISARGTAMSRRWS